MKCLWLLVVFVLCAMRAHAQLDPVVQALVKNMESMRDTTIDPCTDFFQYACGTFINNNPIPANVTVPDIVLPTINGIMYGNDALLAKIVNDPWPIVSDLYLSCMEPDQQQDFNNFFTSLAQQIDGVNVQNEQDLWQLTADLVSRSIAAFMSITTNVDDYQRASVSILPAGNTLSSEEYTDPATYQNLISSIEAAFEIFESAADAAQDAVAVANIEEFIAQAANGPLSNVSVSELSTETGLDFQYLFTTAGVDVDGDSLIGVTELVYFEKLSDISGNFPARSIQRFLEWKAYQTLAFYNASSCWGTDSPPFICEVIMENSPYSPPWDQPSVCRNFVHMVASDLVGLIFTYEIVTPETAGGIRNMTLGIQHAFNKSLPALGWLDLAGISQVEFKLDNVIQIIGHPNRMEKYANLTTSPTQFTQNFYNILGVDQKWFMAGQTGPFNRSDYEFDPMIVNAFYSPTTNTINFPAGILESPMFSGSWPKLFQHARLGYVVGHENTHGFDNHGSLWNAYGLPGDLFDAQTRENFDTNSQCIANYYSQFIAFNTTHVNGNQTLGENIADIGGVKNSHRAYQAYIAQYGPEFADYQLITDLTTDQVYFLFMGQTWCSSENAAYQAYQYEYDVHSPARYRVNGPLSQFDEFAAAFNCPASAPMNPANRCDLW